MPRNENNLANPKVVKEHEWNIHEDELNEQSDAIENNDAMNYEEYLADGLKSNIQPNYINEDGRVVIVDGLGSRSATKRGQSEYKKYIKGQDRAQPRIGETEKLGK